MSVRKIPERLGQPIPVTQSTVQELQLELLRRSSFNALDGEHVAQSLMRHRDLWVSVILDRKPHWSRDYTKLPILWLIKMRDMPDNYWNADTLFLLTDSIEKARRLERIANEEDWAGEGMVHDDQQELNRALGSGPEPSALVTIWWD
jgi:hypothetical protein